MTTMTTTYNCWGDVRVGDFLPELKREVTQEQMNLYAEVSEDENPLHTDPEFAKRTRYGGTIAHGVLILAFVSQCMTNWVPNGWLRGGEIEAKFVAPVYAGDTIVVSGSVAGITDCDGMIVARCEVRAAVGDRTVLAGVTECPLQ